MDTYPARGRSIEIDFGEDGPFGHFAVKLTFSDSDDALTFLVTRGSLLDKTGSCEYRAVPISGGAWMVSWREADGLTVVQVHDFAQGRVWAASTTPDHELIPMDGTLRIL